MTCFVSVALAAGLLGLALVACASDAGLSDVRFRIVADETGEPLANRSLDVYRFVYDVHYDSRDVPWYITSVTTDGDGAFTLDLHNVDVGHVVIQPGQPCGIVRFERASDLRHTRSAGHVRVVRFVTGETRVESNAIYDLQHQTVRIVPISGDPWQEPFTEVLLVAPPYQPSTSGK
jgi:hypothetical protein